MGPNIDLQSRQRIASVGRGHGREIRSFSGHTAGPRLLCFVAPKGDRIISAGDDATSGYGNRDQREVKAIPSDGSPQNSVTSPVAPVGERKLGSREDPWRRITDLEAGKDFQLFDIHHGDVQVYVVAFSQMDSGLSAAASSPRPASGTWRPEKPSTSTPILKCMAEVSRQTADSR